MILHRIWRFLFPPSRWQGCHSPTPYERMAAYERRKGEYAKAIFEARAERWLRNAHIAQVFDSTTAQRVRPSFQPKLPSDNVVPIRRQG